MNRHKRGRLDIILDILQALVTLGGDKENPNSLQDEPELQIGNTVP